MHTWERDEVVMTNFINRISIAFTVPPKERNNCIKAKTLYELNKRNFSLEFHGCQLTRLGYSSVHQNSVYTLENVGLTLFTYLSPVIEISQVLEKKSFIREPTVKLNPTKKVISLTIASHKNLIFLSL